MTHTEEGIKQQAKYYLQFFASSRNKNGQLGVQLKNGAPPELRNLILESPEPVYETLLWLSILGRAEVA